MRHSHRFAIRSAIFLVFVGLGLNPTPSPADDDPLSRILGQLIGPTPGNPGGYRQVVNPYPGYPGGYGQGVNPYPGYPGNPGVYGQGVNPYPAHPGTYRQPVTPYPVNPGGYNGAYGQPAIPYSNNPGGYSSGYSQPAIPYSNNPGGYSSGYSQPAIPYSNNPGGYSQPAIPYPVNPGGPPIQYPAPTVDVFPGPQPGPSQMAALADQLIVQADTFLQAFSPTARVVPEGKFFLSDAQGLRNSALRFRQVVSSGGPAAVLAASFQEMQADWQRMEARLARVSKGRIGPNIANALEMGRTIDQIRGSF